MQSVGRVLQIFGLVIVPMALIYYFDHRSQASEARLMYGELMILALGAAIFVLGNYLVKK